MSMQRLRNKASIALKLQAARIPGNRAISEQIQKGSIAQARQMIQHAMSLQLFFDLPNTLILDKDVQAFHKAINDTELAKAA